MRLRVWSPWFKLTSGAPGPCCSPPYHCSALATPPVLWTVSFPRGLERSVCPCSPTAVARVLPVHFRGHRELWDTWLGPSNVFPSPVSFSFCSTFWKVFLILFLLIFLNCSISSIICLIFKNLFSHCFFFDHPNFLLWMQDLPLPSWNINFKNGFPLFYVVSVFWVPFICFFFVWFFFSPLCSRCLTCVLCAPVPCLYLTMRWWRALWRLSVGSGLVR